MVPTRELAEIVEHVQRAGAKLVLVGDHRQLPELGAGGAFRGLLTRVPVIELTENRRQAAEWEREALGARADRRRRGGGRASTSAASGSWSARTPTRCARGSSRTGGRRVTPTAR